MLLVRLYRVRGHLAADLDPLGLSHRDIPEDLTLEWHEFTGQEDREVYVGGVFGFEWVTVGELYRVLRETYCGKVGLEYMHISDTEERRFLQDKFETPEDTITNNAFGGPDMKTLYVAAGKTLYKLRTEIPGLAR